MLNITTTTSRPLSLVSPPGASEGLCPVCLDAFDTKLPTVTPSECGHRAHTACLERWKIKCVKMTCPVCRTELTGDLVNDEMTNPVVTPGGMPLSLGDFSSALFQAGRTYDVRRADALLASASLSIGESRVCFAVVDRVMVRARMRLSIMPWHEYNQIRNFIGVFVHHKVLAESWCQTAQGFFELWRVLQTEQGVLAGLNPVALKAELLKAAVLPPDYARTTGLLSRIGAVEALCMVACEVMDLVLKKMSRSETGLLDYKEFRDLISIYLCRGIGSETTLGRIMALSVSKDDHVYAQVIKDDFGGSLQGLALSEALSRAAGAIDSKKIKKILDLSDGRVDRFLNPALRIALESIEPRRPSISCKDIYRLCDVIDALAQYGTLERSLLNKALRICVLGDNIFKARALKSDHGAAVDSGTFLDALQKTAQTFDYMEAGLLLDLAAGEPSLRESARGVLASRLQAILYQPGQPDSLERLKLWMFANAFFQHDIIDSHLLCQSLTIFQLFREDYFADVLKSRYGAYLEP